MVAKDVKLRLPKELRKALQREADEARLSLDAHITQKLDNITPPIPEISQKELEKNIEALVSYLERLPACSILSHAVEPNAYWWVKLNIDPEHPLAWRVIQELGFVLNYFSIQEKLPTVFMPVSPPPYLNGGVEFLSWVIESKYSYTDPKWIADILEGRLPCPVENKEEWDIDS